MRSPDHAGHHRWPWVVLAVVGVVAIAGVGVVRHYHLLDRGRTTPLSVDQVVKRFQQSTPSTVTSTTPASTTTAPSANLIVLPKAGVYTYTTTGRDSVDALNGDHHDYPPTTTITVTGSGNCVVQRWDVAAERWSTWTRCVVGGGVTQTAKQDFDRFFGTDQLDAYTCAGDPRPLDAPAGTTWTSTCTEGGATDTITGTVIGSETRTVGTTDHVTLHVRVSIDDGNPADSQVTDTWYLAGTDLIVAQQGANATTNPSPVGDVHYREDYTITLTRITPLT